MGEEKNKTDDDVLRARDIIPPFGSKKQKIAANGLPETKEKPAPPDEQSASGQEPGKAPIKISPIPKFEEIIPASAESGIPQFNLAEQIFAEQRKVSSGRRQKTSRQSQGEKQEQIDEPALYEPVKPWQSLSPNMVIPSPASPQQRIIAEIIARDIEEMIIRNSQLKL